LIAGNRRLGLLLAATLGWSAAAAVAQTPPAPAVAPARDAQPGEQIFQVVTPNSKMTLTNLGSRVLETRDRIKVVDGFDQDKITVKALSPYRIRLHAENTGVTTVKLTDEFEKTYTVEVFVEPDTRELQAYLERLFPASSIEVIGIRDGVVLRGWVTEPSQIPDIMAVAEQFYEIVHPQLTVAGPTQVQLHVKVMEVQRSKLRELGFNFLLTGPHYYVQNAIGGLAPLTTLTSTGFIPVGGHPTPAILPSALPNSEIQFAVAGSNANFQGFLHALQSESLAKVLAEPILVTTSGRPATVHSGGEFPVLVPQSFGNLSIQWREFGVRLEAVPIVLGEGRLRLDLAPEVSERDFSNSVTINGLVVPGITSRSVNTQVEMGFGETLMIGGLISMRRQGTAQKVPLLGELPWIGAAFSRKSYTMGETELLILVTPQLVSPMAPHQVPPGGPGFNSSTPVDRELYLDGNLEVPSYGPECPGGNCQPNWNPALNPTPAPIPAGPAGSSAAPPGQMPSAPPAASPVPTPASGPGGPPLPPPPALETRAAPGKSSSNVQQAGAEVVTSKPSRTTIVNPFKSASVSANKPETAGEGSQTFSKPAAKHLTAAKAEEAQAPAEAAASETKPRTSAFDVKSLPGMIQPKSTSKSTEERGR
jgi:pilus assembly protein CpaC